MRYAHVQEGRFLCRPNRFIAHVEIDGREEICHVKNTGRCRELLTPGATVYCQHFEGGGRKTAFDLIAVEKGRRLINMDAQAPNRVFREWVEKEGFSGCPVSIRPEYRYGDSRLDFCLDDGTGPAWLVEVKGVTLEEEGRVFFPDAPTQRGVRHLQELIRARAEGYRTAVFFVIQMQQVQSFSPNDRTHPDFGRTLRAAAAAGVQVLAYDCRVTPDSLQLDRPVPILL